MNDLPLPDIAPLNATEGMELDCAGKPATFAKPEE